MEIGQDLKEMGQKERDRRYEDVNILTLSAEYERVQNTSWKKRDIELDGIQHMLHAIYANKLIQNHGMQCNYRIWDKGAISWRIAFIWSTGSIHLTTNRQIVVVFVAQAN